MKFLKAFVAIASVLGAVNAVSPIKIKTPVNCLVNPCNAQPCLPSQQCVADYSTGCNFHCLPGPAPFECPIYDHGEGVNCFRSPCDGNTCAVNEICCDNYSKGCDFECHPQ